MRISGSANIESLSIAKKSMSQGSEKVISQGSDTTQKQTATALEQIQPHTVENNEETKAKVQEAVNKLNEMLEVNNSASKFMYHEGLERYYVTVIDRETEEVVKEIPPKRLLDAYFEMQKMLGMIVDEKI